MIPSQPIRVMLVDDHTMVRRGLATFLKVFDDLELVGEADSGEAGGAALRPGPAGRRADGPDDAGDGWGNRHAPDPPAVSQSAGHCPDELQRRMGWSGTRCRPGRSAICSKMCRPMTWPGRFARRTRARHPLSRGYPGDG